MRWIVPLLTAPLLVLLAMTSGCGDPPRAKPRPPTTTRVVAPAAAGETTSTTERKETVTKAIIKTPRGDINLVLFPKTAPNTVANFVKLAKSGFYDGLAFHRVVEGFVIQGGCPNTKPGATGRPGTGGPGYQIKCEVGPGNPEKHSPGTLSMAHAGKDTGGSQFFVTHAATPHLDGKHTVFGRIAGKADLDVVLAVREGDRFSVKIVEEAAK